MTTRIFWLECQLLLRSRVFIALTLVFLGLSFFAGWQGGSLARVQQEAIATAYALEAQHDREALEKAQQVIAGEIDPPWWQSPLNVQAWSYAMIRHASLPPRPLAGVAIADADLKPFLFRINPHPPDRWSNRASELTPSVASYGGFDLTTLILVLTPLLVLVGVSDVLRDRGGTDRQRLAIVQSSRLGRLLLTRLIPRGGLVVFVVTFAMVCGVIATLPPLGQDVLRGIAAIWLAFMFHTVVWLLIASALIFFLRSMIGAYAGYVGLWFLVGVIAPLIVEGAARQLTPPPSPLIEFSREREAVVAARMNEEALTRDYASRDPLAREMLLTALEKDQLLITPTNLLVQKEVDRRRQEDRSDARASRRRFEDNVIRLSRLSPTFLTQGVVFDIAGRGERRRQAFDAQVNRYYADLQDEFVPLLMRRATVDSVLLPEQFAFQEPE